MSWKLLQKETVRRKADIGKLLRKCKLNQGNLSSGRHFVRNCLKESKEDRPQEKISIRKGNSRKVICHQEHISEVKCLGELVNGNNSEGPKSV